MYAVALLKTYHAPTVATAPHVVQALFVVCKVLYSGQMVGFASWMELIAPCCQTLAPPPPPEIPNPAGSAAYGNFKSVCGLCVATKNGIFHIQLAVMSSRVDAIVAATVGSFRQPHPVVSLLRFGSARADHVRASPARSPCARHCCGTFSCLFRSLDNNVVHKYLAGRRTRAIRNLLSRIACGASAHQSS